ncbi:AcrR family transcriptional regulator [Cytobacillus horneckiae]|uniref:TetR/AcrR family transcriptional regulator n=1 Tax=Cytobacillus horneckiae TaxID=549687 RepID=A0A2N0ZGA6_9BACI|nr:TetR/AcrR family transcriptional regulator [Cytobacillus horneckiae]MBN6886092.1 TetR/AcrR family transcriptional regulator [Cytobacillus horneckiae]MCM3176394.1 TetR/AcrR family transcriptional regulator [Cytobacillus horneckiae]MEC1155772.1 TetR/AcrR family transcriptional regulator [Cytobacillus horneckiae]MED2939311.1 TetR/AcrR family transcriptional regulator [Cytobacillus horneckiae]PKG28537.1 TetR/AcrR family transcriptional regulator [Cytobacillus horneckiae]
MNKRQMQALETKRKILQTALALFQEKGFSHVSVDEIIDKTNTSKGAFYNHFKSKHDIFFEKFKEIDQYYINDVEPELAKLQFIEQKLHKFFEMQMDFIDEHFGWDVTRTIYEHELNVDKESFFLNPNRPLYEVLTRLCDEAKEEGYFRQDIPTKSMVTVFARAIRGMLYDWSIHQGTYSLTKEYKLLFHTVIAGLRQD